MRFNCSSRYWVNLTFVCFDSNLRLHSFEHWAHASNKFKINRLVVFCAEELFPVLLSVTQGADNYLFGAALCSHLASRFNHFKAGRNQMSANLFRVCSFVKESDCNI